MASYLLDVELDKTSHIYLSNLLHICINIFKDIAGAFLAVEFSLFLIKHWVGIWNLLLV